MLGGNLRFALKGNVGHVIRGPRWVMSVTQASVVLRTGQNGSGMDLRSTVLDVHKVSVCGKDSIRAEPEYDLVKS